MFSTAASSQPKTSIQCQKATTALVAPNKQPLFFSFVWTRLNNCMNYKETATQKWIRDNGMSVASFNTTHPTLLKAQQAAHQLLTHHSDLLTAAQRQALALFRQKMTNTRSRQRLKAEAAYPILNINTKISRQLFKQHRHLQHQPGKH